VNLTLQATTKSGPEKVVFKMPSRPKAGTIGSDFVRGPLPRATAAFIITSPQSQEFGMQSDRMMMMMLPSPQLLNVRVSDM
jgi:hypothetical protein